MKDFALDWLPLLITGIVGVCLSALVMSGVLI